MPHLASVSPSPTPIAVVGMAARFPGAPSLHSFWQTLLGERETLTDLDEDVLRQNEVDYDTLSNDPTYVRRAGILEGADYWDREFFGCTARQAALMDPQHRIWHECAWEALEDGCLDPASYGGQIGVFTGIGTRGNYLMANLVPNRAYLDTFVRNGDVDVYETQVLNDRDYLATRTARMFDLRGPALTVQAACSTSLAAIALGCQSLWLGTADAVLAGGSSIQFPQARGYRHQPGGILSRDGVTRPFDRKASGTVFTAGVGAVLLERLPDAVAQRRPIYAILRAAVISNDGADAASYIAPSRSGQQRAVQAALQSAGVHARSISFVEAHGTATALGDPVEVGALTDAYRAHTRDNGYCGLGSVKSNIGHTSAAAGVAGFIKTALSLHHKKLPASLHFESPNPQLGLEESPFYVVDSTRDWECADVRRAAVSSFGVGGANAHAILEEHTP